MSLLLVWDFDRSFLQDDCEWGTLAKFGLDQEARKLSQDEFKGRWPALTNELWGRLAQDGITRQQLSARVAELQPCMQMLRTARAVDAARARGTPVRQRVLSDANTEFIRIILAQLGLQEAVEKVVSNPASWDGDRLRVEPLLGDGVADGLPAALRTEHCPPNLAKGAVLASWLADEPELAASTVVYIGDGRGDFGAAVQLREDDVLCAREGETLFGGNTLYSIFSGGG